MYCYEDYRKAKAMVKAKHPDAWGYAYSLEIFKKRHPQRASSYEERMRKEQQNCGADGRISTEKTNKEKIKEIMSIENWGERHKAILENMELFNQWMGKGKKTQDYAGRSAAEMQKRSEIMNIKDIDIRRRAIAENMHLFEN